MKIAIVTLTTTSKRTGVAEYLINLTDRLQHLDKLNKYYVFTSVDNSYMFKLIVPNFKEIKLRITHSKLGRVIFYIWLIFIFPIWCKINSIKLVHLPNTFFVSGLFPTISTIHDITELKAKKYSRFRTFFRRLMIQSAIKNSKAIITVSSSSAKDLLELGAVNVFPINLGFDSPYPLKESAQDIIKVLDKYKVTSKKYILFIGTLMKHKNVPSLIYAYQKALKTGIDADLVIVGAPDNDMNEITRAINVSEMNRIKLISFIPAFDKFSLLSHARIFCLISSYEGFGIPILEAQAAQVPVIASKISSLPEVSGIGAHFVSPVNLIDETADAICKLWDDRNYQAELIDGGIQNIARFSWHRFASETLDVYLKIHK